MDKLNMFDKGGSHEENPYGGIPIGNENTVEQGETKFKDFVFSDRIKINESLIKEFNLPSYLKNKTFAEATKVINSKFKDREDRISTTTKQGFLETIAQAQETLKQREDFSKLNTNDQKALGGLINTIGEGSMLIDQFKGETSPNSFEAVLAGMNSGTKVGSIFGPIGSGIGAGVGTIAGLIGSGKARKEIKRENQKNAIINSNQFTNDFAFGGPILPNNYKPKTAESFQDWLDVNHKGWASGYEGGVLNKGKGYGNYGKLTTAAWNKYNKDYNKYLDEVSKKEEMESVKNLIKPVSEIDEKYGPSQEQLNAVAITENDGNLFNDNKKSTDNYNLKKNKTNLDLKSVLNDSLRYSPIVMNLMQLSKLQKPSRQTLNRLNNRFDREYVDEKSLMNISNNEFNNMINSLSSTGASEGAIRNAILAAGLNKNKALSQAYMEAANQNRNTNAQAQQFNLNVDQNNINQSNLETDINDRNQGAYLTEKSRLLSQIGNDLGSIGKEQVQKEIVKKTFGYTYDGEYWRKPNGEKATKEEQEMLNSQTKANRLGGFLFKK